MLLTSITGRPEILYDIPTIEFDLTVTISVIIALCAIISPMLTAIINNMHQTKIKKLELQHQLYQETVLHQQNLFEKYLKYAGRCISCADHDALKDYGEYYFAALMYADNDLQSEMSVAHKAIQEMNLIKASDKIEALVPKIRTMQQKL